MEKVLSGPSANEESHAIAEHGAGRYVFIWVLLMVFTAVTVATSRLDLGAGNIVLAMAIAAFKATLVVLFFMHLSQSHGMNRLVFVVSVLFLVLMILGVFGDILDRLPLTLPDTGPGVPATSE